MTTNVPPLSINGAGIVLPTEQEILDGVLADFNDAFGGNLNLNLETPQGQLASSLAAIIADKNNVIADLINQVHPDYADGIMQDAIAKIYFIERKPATDSVVTCVFTGLSGTIIPDGFSVQDEQGNNWTIESQVEIAANGTVTAVLKNPNVVTAQAGTVNKIFSSLVGLDRVSNPNDAIPGSPVESRADFRDRRQRSVAINSHGTPKAVYANVFAVDGVSDVYVIDNPKSTPVTVGATNTVIKPHSIYVAVVGGDDEDVAKAILNYAGSGCDFNGNTDVTVYDDTYDNPKPSYQVSFMRPQDVQVHFKVIVGKGALIGYQDVVQTAIIEVFRSSKKGRIGGDLYAMDYAAAVLAAIADNRLLNIKIGLSATALGDSVSIGIDKTPILNKSNIQVVTDD